MCSVIGGVPTSRSLSLSLGTSSERSRCWPKNDYGNLSLPQSIYPKFCRSKFTSAIQLMIFWSGFMKAVRHQTSSVWWRNFLAGGITSLTVTGKHWCFAFEGMTPQCMTIDYQSRRINLTSITSQKSHRQVSAIGFRQQKSPVRWRNLLAAKRRIASVATKKD